MSSFNLAKKLLPAKKAWESFTKKLQSKPLKLHISKSLKKITTHRLKSLRSIRPLQIPRALPCCHSSRSYHRRHLCQYYSGHHHVQKNVAAINVDELFAKQIYQDEGRSTSKAKEVLGAPSNSGGGGGGGKNKGKGEKDFSLPRWQGIDERAEEFISKFRKDMMLQREKSIIDFQEMLARSA